MTDQNKSKTEINESFGTIEVAKGSFWKNKATKTRWKVTDANEFECTVTISNGESSFNRSVQELFNGFRFVSTTPGADVYLFASDKFTKEFLKKYGV